MCRVLRVSRVDVVVCCVEVSGWVMRTGHEITKQIKDKGGDEGQKGGYISGADFGVLWWVKRFAIRA